MWRNWWEFISHVNLNTPNVDQFLCTKISKKKTRLLEYLEILASPWQATWSFDILSLTIWFFIMVWGGSNKILRNIRCAICNTFGQAKSNSHKLGLIGRNDAWRRSTDVKILDHEATKTNLLCMWIVKAMRLGEFASNSSSYIYWLDSTLKEVNGTVLAWIGSLVRNTKGSQDARCELY